MSGRMTLARRLLLINTTLIGLLILVSLTVWFMMDKVMAAADRISKTNVPQLELIAELELNVTRASLQVRHAILARNPQELQATLDDVTAKKKLLMEKLEAFGSGMIDEDGRKAFAPLPALMDEFWRHGEANVVLINEGRKAEMTSCVTQRSTMFCQMGLPNQVSVA